MKKILIQANNLDTVVDSFMYIYLHKGCTKQDLSDYCGFSLRQVDYYTNACKYLGLINQDWSPTELAEDIFKNSQTEVNERIYEIVINDELMGSIYHYILNNPDKEPIQYAIDLVKKEYPGYSEAVYQRRSDNIVKWCNRIISYMSKK